jgi:HEAT repeat protein
MPMIAAAALIALLPFQAGDSVEALLERLRTEDAVARRQAQISLVARGAEAVPDLLRALESASPRPEEEIARLVKKLESASWKDRNAATEALVKLGRSAVAPLEARLGAADPEVAWRLRAAMAEIQEKAGRDEQAEEIRAAVICDVLGQAGDGRAVAPLLKLLSADAPSKRVALKVRACQALGLLRDGMEAAQAEEASDRVLQVLERSPGALEKALLIKTLGRLKVAGAARPLAALLSDRSEKNAHLKRCCVTALAAIGEARGLRAIVDALASDDVYVRQAAGAALEELAGNSHGYDPRLNPEESREAAGKFRRWGAEKYGKDWE